MSATEASLPHPPSPQPTPPSPSPLSPSSPTAQSSSSHSSSRSSSSSPPPSPPLLPLPALDYRWVHAGAAYLDLLPTPITSASTTYKAFSAAESERIEDAWEGLSVEERQRAIDEWGKYEGEGAPARVAKQKEKNQGSRDKEKEKGRDKERTWSSGSRGKEDPVDMGLERDGRGDGMPEKEVLNSGEEQKREGGGGGEGDEENRYREMVAKRWGQYDDLEKVEGVAVSQDSLFEVSLQTLSLHPVFWAHTGPRVSVMRGTWFVGDESRPCSWELAEEIEKGYLEIKPWQPSYKHELATAISLGPAAEEKLKHSLPARFGQGLGIIFDDAEKGRLLTTGAMTYLSRAFWSSIRAKPGGTYVYRGYDAARAGSGKETDKGAAASSAQRSRSRSHSRRGSNASTRSGVIDKFEKDDSLLRRTVSRGDAPRPSSSSTATVTHTHTDPLVGAASKLIGKVEKETLGVGEALSEFREDVLAGGGEKRDRKESGLSAQAVQEEFEPVVESSEGDAPCSDLILVVHGIGQQLATTYEGFNFVYAGNQLRQVLRKQCTNPALSSIIRDRRAQILPVQWRASLNLFEEKTQEDAAHGMDNRFTMADITLAKSIPYVRELTNSVLLDIPLYMSHHRAKMIEAVCTQANRLYRLWLARNPDFEKRGGRVHLIGHSLGSALAAHILSNQPTKMPPISQLPRQVITQTRDRFLFNTSNLFLCGSPLGIFLHLDQTQLMPRKGRERTMHSPQDEALDRSGKFGCMAIDSLYNVFYTQDPVAYSLNAAVDVKLSKTRPPLAITSVTAPFFSSVTEGLGTISRYLPPLPSLPWGGYGSESSQDKDKSGGSGGVRRPGVIRLPSGIEMSGPSGEERLEGSRGERRFSALNPHGNVDFYLPSAGVSEYLDMITAHQSYWSDPSFAAFLLAEIFSTRWDQVRTGMGLAHQAVAEGMSM